MGSGALAAHGVDGSDGAEARARPPDGGRRPVGDVGREADGAFPTVLRALSDRRSVSGRPLAESDLPWLVRSGLGPIVWNLVERGRVAVPEAWHPPLRAADLLARAEAHARARRTEEVLGWFRRDGLPPPVLLKGVAVASRYYAAPHARVMGDVDLLLAAEAVDAGVRILRARGFVMSDFAAPEWWDTHHHAPPLTDPDGDVTIELHRALLPPTAPTRGDPPFDAASLDDRVVGTHLGAEPVGLLVPECELALLAAAWANDLSTFLGRPGLQRPLVDAVLLLDATRDSFDWDRFLAWTVGTPTGDCVWTLLSLLDRFDALPVDPALLRPLRSGPSAIDAGSVGVVHRIVTRHVLVERRFGRVSTRTNLARVTGALLRPGPAWRRWLEVPREIVLPAGRAERDPLRFLWGRLRAALRAG